MKSFNKVACRLYVSGLVLVLLPAVPLFATDPVVAANGCEAGDDQARAAHGDRMGDDGLVLLRVPLGLAGGAVLVPIRSSDLRAAGRAHQADFILLSMEEAATFRGTQMPGCCYGTGVYAECLGNYDSCSYYTAEACPTWIFPRTNNWIRMCVDWRPCGPPTQCVYVKQKPCLSMCPCTVDPNQGTCKSACGWWPWCCETLYRNDDYCTQGPQPVPPGPAPNP